MVYKLIAQHILEYSLFSTCDDHAYVHTRVQHFATPCDVACQAPLSMGLSQQEYWSGLSFPTPGDLPDPGIEPTSLVSPALTGRFFTTCDAPLCETWKINKHTYIFLLWMSLQSDSFIHSGIDPRRVDAKSFLLPTNDSWNQMKFGPSPAKTP